jgi:hypothetical protein
MTMSEAGIEGRGGSEPRRGGGWFGEGDPAF